ncbi:MAG TPA: polysaccharide deacetylase family protein [Anaerolineales bacterium]|nr:polysaccharide deacetylase family protein [Anaerolineales bacterium]
MNNTIGVAVSGKGLLKTARRAAVISTRYGLTSRKMDNILAHTARILNEYDCAATFPLVTAALVRNRGVAEKYESQNFEYAIHGYYHIDHKSVPFELQAEYFSKARQKFEERGLTVSGFRCPYLRWNADTLKAIKQAGLLYDTSQVIAWDVAKEYESESYRRVLGFYGAVSANDYLALPRYDDGLVRIPYCVPDDEALIDRLEFASADALNNPWLAILEATYQRGELFTLGLHPERVYLCETALRETLKAARQLRPQVWFASLDVISSWWLDRSNAQVSLRAEPNNVYHMEVTGPEGITLLARNAEVLSENQPWDGDYVQFNGTQATIRSASRPVIGVSSRSHPYLLAFLRQQGYIVETAEEGQQYSIFIDRETFAYEEEKALIENIEMDPAPLVRLGRWPNGARSALCVTGDIDALTIWDYYFRFLGK